MTPAPARAKPEVFAFVVLSAMFLGWTLASGLRPGAYADYLAEWHAVVAGQDPWRPQAGVPLNAYGPLFNLLAPLAWLNPIAPKLLFAAGYLGFVGWLVLRKMSAEPPRHRLAIIALCLLNPFPWVEIAHFGFFDVVVGLVCVGAVHVVRRRHDRLAGALVGIGVLLKFLPIVILPVLAGSGRHWRLGTASAAGLVTLVGMGASLAVWGPSTLDPLLFAGRRPPVLSIYDILGSPDSPLWLGLRFDLTLFEKPLVVVTQLWLLAWSWHRRAGPAVAVLLAVLLVLAFYRSGYNNYQMIAFMLLAYLFAGARDELRMTRGVVGAAGIYLGCLVAIDAGFPVVRRIVSADAASMYLSGTYLARWFAALGLIAAIVGATRSDKDQPRTNRGPTSPPAPAASFLL